MNYLGVDIGGTSIKVAIVSTTGEVVDRMSYVITKKETQEEVITNLSKQIKEFIKGKDVQSIGIGCAGAINSVTGECEYSNNLNWHHINIVKMMEEIVGLKCYIGNDANVAILGEAKFGSATQYENAVLITLGTGVGGGLYLNNQLYEGVDGKGAEIGHMYLYMNEGRECTCGKKGCVETYCSATALIKSAINELGNYKDSSLHNIEVSKIGAKEVFDAYHAGDELAKKVVGEYIVYLSETILCLINIFRPNAVLISGGICRQGQWFVDAIDDYLKANHYGFGTKDNKKVDVVIASLGADTGIYGAAALAMEKSK